MDKHLFDHDPYLGITEYFYYDDNTGTVTIEQVQDVRHIIEQNKAQYNAIDEKARWGEWQKVASIPMNLWADLNAKGITRDSKAFKAWLNDSGNRFFRTRPGTI